MVKSILRSKVLLSFEIKSNQYNQQTQRPIGSTKKRRVKLSTIGRAGLCWRRSIGYCEWIWIRRGSMRTAVPSMRYSRAPVQSATLRLLTSWSAGSTPRLIVALSFVRDLTLRWGLVRDRCESVRVGIQRSCVGIQRSCVRRKQ